MAALAGTGLGSPLGLVLGGRVGPGRGLGLASMSDAGFSWRSSLGTLFFVFRMATVAEAGEDSSLGILFFLPVPLGSEEAGWEQQDLV